MWLAIIIFSLLPALIYSFVIYLIVPYKTIKFSEAAPYIVVGFFSVVLLRCFWEVYPEWNHLADNIISEPYRDLPPFRYLHTYYFIQIAFIEELSKLLVFLLYEKYRRKVQIVKDHPISIMFFVGVVSLGFSVIENIYYGVGSEYPMDTLWWRSITAVIGHMVFGLFMGYWIAIGRMGPRLYDRSLVDIIINKRKILRNIVFTTIGLIVATILHGVYDLHIEMSGPSGITGIYMLLIMSLLGVFWCFKNLNRLYKVKIKSLKNKLTNKL